MKFSATKLRAGNELYKDAHFNIWTKYVNDLFPNDISKATLTMASTLTNNVGDKALGSMLCVAKETTGTRVVATRLQARQFQVWQDNGISADNVFRNLGLYEVPRETWFKSPRFRDWTKYVRRLHPEEATTTML
ncbi:unnamed protein product [Phytophthora lilii]|uniref:Unnamed protein product n=1 Tax=Phytophthora lilii TaxID=2077276 RepID=A0A9W6WGK5_9STRA|nr:unnamed protein product [Phytophthora lilii]